MLAALACVVLMGPGLVIAQTIGMRGVTAVTIASTLPVVVLGYLVDSRRYGMALCLAVGIVLCMVAWFVLG